jgi:hypothetical protein
MKLRWILLLGASFLPFCSISHAQSEPKLENATAAVLRAFETHDVVIFGEMHGNKQEYAWLRLLVATPEFADRVDDIVMEMGNSLYQKSVDRYISGEDVPWEQVQKAWQNTVGAIGPPSPVTASLYQAIREENLKRKGKHQMRVLCGDPYVDWEKVKERSDLAPYMANRDQWFTQVVKDEVLAKHRRALLIMGSGHFLRVLPFHRRFSIEPELQAAGAKTYLIIVATNTPGSYDDRDSRFDSWPAPLIVSLADNWVGELLAMPMLSGGGAEGYQWMNQPVPGSGDGTAHPPVKLKEEADAILYLGPRDSLTAINTTRTELAGTPYEKEIERRLVIEGFPADFAVQLEATNSETPQFSRPQSTDAPAPPPPQPAKSAQPSPPKTVGPPPLPPRPPSQ